MTYKFDKEYVCTYWCNITERSTTMHTHSLKMKVLGMWITVVDDRGKLIDSSAIVYVIGRAEDYHRRKSTLSPLCRQIRNYWRLILNNANRK